MKDGKSDGFSVRNNRKVRNHLINNYNILNAQAIKDAPNNDPGVSHWCLTCSVGVPGIVGDVPVQSQQKSGFADGDR